MGPLLVLLLALPAAVAAGEVSTSQMTRRLRSFSERKGHIWGRCGEWDSQRTGCNLKASMCSDHLSEGPAAPDLEVKIGGLPPSSSSNEVHLQWWSPRKSESDYLPLDSPYGCTIYRDVLDAYPLFGEPEFNGGNVRVSTSGEAVIRVHTPSTYQMYCWIMTPHVHLRVCANESLVHHRRDAIYFTTGGPEISSGCNSNDIPYKVMGYRMVNPPSGVMSAEWSSDWIVPAGMPAIQNAPVLPPTTTTALTTSTTTTIKMFPETAAEGNVLVDLRVQTAREALDMDALEFSPVYYCFLEGKFYDHFSAGCAETCPAHAEVRHGQCVRPEASRVEAMTLKASWKLKVECGARCWDETKKVKLHHLRLAAAEHLDVPFQEVTKVALDILSDGEASRRLDTNKMVRLSIIVESRRVTAGDEALLRNDFITDATAASDLLGQKVHSLEASHDEAGDVAESQIDPYTSAYEAIEKKGPSSVLANSPNSLSDLPMEALLGGATAAILLGMVMGVYIYRKRQSLKKQQEASIEVAKGVELEADKSYTADPKAAAAAAKGVDRASI